jgi:6-phosphogluconolactonase
MSGVTIRRSLRLSATAALLVTVVLLVSPGGTAAQGAAAGHVYVLNNDLAGANSITVFARAADGGLSDPRVVTIGGRGSLAAFSDGTQGSLIITADGQRLFAVDAGSDQISVIDVRGGQLAVAGVFGSAGAGPVSLTYGGGLLYVLNAANASDSPANVAGFSVDSSGALHSIPGAIRPLSSAHPNPAQVLLDPLRRTLLITEKGTNLIDVYQVGGDGSLTRPTTVHSSGNFPFGMNFVQSGGQSEVIVADAAAGPNGTGGVTAYSLVDRLLNLQGPVFDGQIAPCWMVTTADGRFAYTSNADSRSISGYRIGSDGGLSLLNADGVTGLTPSDTFPLEEALSRDSRFLYVLDSRLLLKTPGPATLGGYRIESNGALTSVVDEAKITLPFSAIGQAAD